MGRRMIAQRIICLSAHVERGKSFLATRWMLAAATIIVLSALSLTLIEDPLLARTLIVAGTCLTLWLSEAVPPYVPTFVLWAFVTASAAILRR